MKGVNFEIFPTEFLFFYSFSNHPHPPPPPPMLRTIPKFHQFLPKSVSRLNFHHGCLLQGGFFFFTSSETLDTNTDFMSPFVTIKGGGIIFAAIEYDS